MPLFVGTLICFFSVITTAIQCWIDYNEENSEEYIKVANYDEEKKESVWDQITSLSILFWLSSTIGATLYANFGSFKYISPAFLTATKFKNVKDEIEANKKASIYTTSPYYISIILTPIVGVLLDKFGERGWAILGGAISSFVAYIFLDIFDPLVAIIVLGFSFSVFSIATWAGISLTVNKTGQVSIISLF